MGTNYWMIVDPCPHCGRGSDRYHICKSLRTFRGYRAYESPFGVEIRSWADWREALTGHVRVDDEYGTAYTTEEFIRMVEEATPEQRKQHVQLMFDSLRAQGVYDPDCDWVDKDGYAFYAREFC
jgi:hypothetical protein